MRINEMADTLREVLATALDANLSVISVSQNKDTKRLAAWAAIIAAPTAIAGIYGMNFQYMPELGLAIRLLCSPRRNRRGVQRAMAGVQTVGLAVENRAKHGG